MEHHATQDKYTKAYHGCTSDDNDRSGDVALYFG
jgi:hypothetical protein